MVLISYSSSVTDCCWAIATCTAIDAAYFLEKGIQIQTSCQELIDCGDSKDKKGKKKKLDEEGCFCGSVNTGFRYIHKNGVRLEEDYPFQGKRKICKAIRYIILNY